jgi:hypothetical protein
MIPSRNGRIAVPLLALVALASASLGAEQKGHSHTRPAGGGVTSLDVYADVRARLHLLIAEDVPGGAVALKYARSEDAGQTWLPAIAVGVGQPPPDPVHRGMDAQIAAAGDHVVAVWTTEGSEDRFRRGPMASAISADGGRTWKAGPNPADDGKATGHAFVDVAADADGVFHCVWLDSRTGVKGLRYARSTDGGVTWSANHTLVEKTCECCWNALATAPGGRVWVLYRQLSPRDMAVVASADGGRTWGAPSVAGNFDWQFQGCPHVGGGLTASPDARSQEMHAVVWTAKTGAPASVFAVRSADAGKSWADPVPLGNWKASHPDVAAGAGGRVVAAWDALTEKESAIFTASSTDGGKTWSEPSRLSLPNRSATHPKVVRVGEKFCVFWTQTMEGEATAWRSALVP